MTRECRVWLEVNLYAFLNGDVRRKHRFFLLFCEISNIRVTNPSTCSSWWFYCINLIIREKLYSILRFQKRRVLRVWELGLINPFDYSFENWIFAKIRGNCMSIIFKWMKQTMHSACSAQSFLYSTNKYACWWVRECNEYYALSQTGSCHWKTLVNEIYSGNDFLLAISQIHIYLLFLPSFLNKKTYFFKYLFNQEKIHN